MTNFERALDMLVADRSPRSCTHMLSERERLMLMYAQLIRGSCYEPCSAAFRRTLRQRVAAYRTSRRP
jgi:hypothetical protein